MCTNTLKECFTVDSEVNASELALQGTGSCERAQDETLWRFALDVSMVAGFQRRPGRKGHRGGREGLKAHEAIRLAEGLAMMKILFIIGLVIIGTAAALLVMGPAWQQLWALSESAY